LRGGTAMGDPAAWAQEGLSPLARGNRCRPMATCPSGGSIPACAGEPQATLYKPSPFRVYPRLRGGTGKL